MKNKMKIIFFIFMMVLPIVNSSSISSDKSYLLSINNHDGKLSYDDLKLFDAVFSEHSNKNEGDYRVDLIGGEIVIYSVRFDIRGQILPTINPECLNEETNEVICDLGKLDQDVPLILINLPYYETAKKIEVYHLDELLFSYSLVELNFFSLETFQNYKYYFIGGAIFLVIFVLWLFLRKKDNSLPPNGPKF
jgi:hypothetical protein